MERYVNVSKVSSAFGKLRFTPKAPKTSMGLSHGLSLLEGICNRKLCDSFYALQISQPLALQQKLLPIAVACNIKHELLRHKTWSFSMLKALRGQWSSPVSYRRAIDPLQEAVDFHKKLLKDDRLGSLKSRYLNPRLFSSFASQSLCRVLRNQVFKVELVAFRDIKEFSTYTSGITPGTSAVSQFMIYRTGVNKTLRTPGEIHFSQLGIAVKRYIYKVFWKRATLQSQKGKLSKMYRILRRKIYRNSLFSIKEYSDSLGITKVAHPLSQAPFPYLKQRLASLPQHHCKCLSRGAITLTSILRILTFPQLLSSFTELKPLHPSQAVSKGVSRLQSCFCNRLSQSFHRLLSVKQLKPKTLAKVFEEKVNKFEGLTDYLGNQDCTAPLKGKIYGRSPQNPSMRPKQHVKTR